LAGAPLAEKSAFPSQSLSRYQDPVAVELCPRPEQLNYSWADEVIEEPKWKKDKAAGPSSAASGSEKLPGSPYIPSYIPYRGKKVLNKEEQALEDERLRKMRAEMAKQKERWARIKAFRWK
jgi:hypothetical protein